MPIIHTPGLTKPFKAAADIEARRIVKIQATDDVATATAVADPIIGVTGSLGALAGKTADVILSGVAEVTYGGAVAHGDPLRADAAGKAVKATPAAGTNNRIVGFALVDGAADDIGSVLIAPGFLQG